jgi:pantothenate kinase-related protein Tda10
LIDLKKQKNADHGLLVGVSAIQGAGKTTQGEILEVLLTHFGFSTISRSIDDHYITHQELCELRQKDPRFIRRGVTHDIALAVQDLKDLEQMTDSEPILVSGYFKGAHHGDGDRFRWVNPSQDVVLKAKVLEENLTVNKEQTQTLALQIFEVLYKGNEIKIPSNMGSDIPVVEHLLPEELITFLKNHLLKELTITGTGDRVLFAGETSVTVALSDLPTGWRVVSKKPDFIFYDGWMLGARTIEDESIFAANLPALETPEAQEFAKFVNKKLADYEPLWQMLDFMTVLYVPNYQISVTWRDQAEEALRSKGEGMSHDEIKEFVYYFWRSVHPGIHIKHLAQDVVHTQQVVIIQDDHGVKEVLDPGEVKVKYP